MKQIGKADREGNLKQENVIKSYPFQLSLFLSLFHEVVSLLKKEKKKNTFKKNTLIQDDDIIQKERL